MLNSPITVNKITNKPVNVVVVKKSSGILSSTAPVTVKNVPTGNRLDQLNDVQPGGETQGAVPVYDQTTDTYIVKKLDLSEVTGILDGGIF